MYILAAIAVLLILWAWVIPSLAPKAKIDDLGAQAGRASQSAANQGKQVYRGIRGRLKLRSDKKDLAQRFRQWALESGDARDRLGQSLPGWADDFAAWLNRLSDKEAVEFSQDVARFCASQNFDIAWLNDPQINADPMIKQAVEEAVLLYGVAWWRADQAQSDVQALLKLKSFLAKPNTKDNKAFGQALLSGLAANNLITIPPTLVTSPEKDRLDYMKRSIEQVSQRHPEEFSRVLRQVATAQPVAPAPSETSSIVVAAPAPAGGD